MEQELIYLKYGDYLIPNINLSYDTSITLGKYGRLRWQYLQENASMLYNDLILTEQLFPHLHEIEEIAHQRLEIVQNQLLEKDPPPDKETHQLEWVQHMNAIKAQAEEMIFSELIYN